MSMHSAFLTSLSLSLSLSLFFKQRMVPIKTANHSVVDGLRVAISSLHIYTLMYLDISGERGDWLLGDYRYCIYREAKRAPVVVISHRVFICVLSTYGPLAMGCSNVPLACVSGECGWREEKRQGQIRRVEGCVWCVYCITQNACFTKILWRLLGILLPKKCRLIKMNTAPEESGGKKEKRVRAKYWREKSTEPRVL